MKSDPFEYEPGLHISRPELARFGRQLKERRQAWGMSQARLAHRSRTTQATVSAIEAGRGNPTYDTLADLAGAVSGRLDLTIRSPHR